MLTGFIYKGLHSYKGNTFITCCFGSPIQICDVIYQNESNVGIFWSSESSAEVIVSLKKIFTTNFDFGEITFIMMLFCQGNKNIILYLWLKPWKEYLKCHIVTFVSDCKPVHVLSRMSFIQKMSISLWKNQMAVRWPSSVWDQHYVDVEQGIEYYFFLLLEEGIVLVCN